MKTVYLLRRTDMLIVQAFEDCTECEDIAIELNQRAMSSGLGKLFYVEESNLLKNVDIDNLLQYN